MDAGGGYAPEYHDHPTLDKGGPAGDASEFKPRPRGSEHNAGNQTLPVDGVDGLTKGHLEGGQRWDLGEPDDAERAVLIDTVLQPRHGLPPHRHDDWRALLVLDGSMRVGDRELTPDDMLVIEPRREVAAFVPGAEGVHLLEVARTAAAVSIVCGDEYEHDPQYRDVLANTYDVTFHNMRV
jgi:hypothetical protein